jgi:peptidoglycan/LPS O-acetylase OafA/YrhL
MGDSIRSGSGDAARTASGVPIVPALDGFRTYAILGVVASHLLIISGAVSAQGTTFDLLTWAVLGNVIDAFFIISGFVLFLPIVVRGGSFGDVRSFAIGRAVRLLPAYWLSLAVLVALIATVPPDPLASVTGSASVDAPNALLHLGALQTPARLFDNDLAIGFGVNGPLWMISVIAGFYVILPFVARQYFRHPLLGLAIAAAVTLGWKEAVLHLGGLFQALGQPSSPSWLIRLIATDQFPGWAFSFALGMTGAWAYVRFAERRPPEAVARLAVIVAAVALPVYAVFAYLYGHYSVDVFPQLFGSWARSFPLTTMGNSLSRAVLMAAIAVGPLWMQRPFVNRPVRRLSNLSYSLYLIHFVVAIYVGLELLDLPTNGTPATIALWFAVVLPLSLGYAYLASRFVERPAVAWGRRLVAGRPRPLHGRVPRTAGEG